MIILGHFSHSVDFFLLVFSHRSLCVICNSCACILNIFVVLHTSIPLVLHLVFKSYFCKIMLHVKHTVQNIYKYLFCLERLKIIFRVMTSLLVRDINDFLIFRVLLCSEIFSGTTRNILFKFSQMIDKWLKFVPFESQVSSSKSSDAR